MPFKPGERILIQTPKKRFLITLKKDARIHTNKGYIEHNDIIGQEPGVKLKTSLGLEAWAFTPSLYDLVIKVQRKTNIIYPKDIAFIITYLGIKSGWRVLEAGSGSGALTTALAYYVSPGGKVFSYEKRQDLQDKAAENVEKAGLAQWVEFKIGDVTKKVDEKELDAFLLDIPTPWKAVENAYHALKPGGFVSVYIPTVNQLEKAYLALKEGGFSQLNPLEVLFRKWKLEKDATRPEFEMVGHTGFLLLARKAIEPINQP
jgi:tRNA (adenine57-N1/adenine58-N1)-methyltransferase